MYFQSAQKAKNTVAECIKETEEIIFQCKSEFDCPGEIPKHDKNIHVFLINW